MALGYDAYDSHAEWNAAVIAEFRANAGHVGGFFEESHLLLLHSVGAKSGLERVNPLGYRVDADRLFVIAAAGGADDNPYWFYNVVAHPRVIVEVGADTLRMQASISAEPERTRLFDKFATERPRFRDYQALTKRILPVVILSRV